MFRGEKDLAGGHGMTTERKNDCKGGDFSNVLNRSYRPS